MTWKKVLRSKFKQQMDELLRRHGRFEFEKHVLGPLACTGFYWPSAAAKKSPDDAILKVEYSHANPFEKDEPEKTYFVRD